LSGRLGFLRRYRMRRTDGCGVMAMGKFLMVRVVGATAKVLRTVTRLKLAH